MIPEEITNLKICVREDAININDNFRRQVEIPLRPSALPLGISFTSLGSPSIANNSNSKVVSQDLKKSQKLTGGELY